MTLGKATACAIALVFVWVVLGGCGRGDDAKSTAAGHGAHRANGTRTTTVETGSVLEFETAPHNRLAYTAKEVIGHAGKVTIIFRNPQSIGHVVKIEDSHGRTVAETPLVTAGTTSIPADLPTGVYKFYCSTPGHRAAGMEGTLRLR